MSVGVESKDRGITVRQCEGQLHSMESCKCGVTLCVSPARYFEYDTGWHLVRHKHKPLSPHTNVKHPSSWMHARAPAESRINDASLPSPVTTNLRGWGQKCHLWCNAAPLRCVFKLWICDVSSEHSNFEWSLYYSRNTTQRKDTKLSETYISIPSVGFSMERSPCSITESCLSHFISIWSRKWERFIVSGQSSKH